MKAVVAAFNQEKALVGAFSVISNLRMDLFEAQLDTDQVFIQTVSSNHDLDIVCDLFRLIHIIYSI